MVKTALKSEACLGFMDLTTEPKKVNGLVKVYLTIFKQNIATDVVFLQ